MSRSSTSTDAPTLPLQNAVLCIDCEAVSAARFDECPACGGHSLVGIARILGGPLSGYKSDRSGEEEVLRFDLDITIQLKHVAAADLNAMVDSIGRLLGPRLGRGQASCHVSVEPVVERRSILVRAAQRRYEASIDPAGSKQWPDNAPGSASPHERMAAQQVTVTGSV